MENYRDLGVSAFRGKNADKGALKAFLDRVEAGQIPPGSYLIVESLDRLSRTDITFALQMFLGLINSGIVVVTLADQRVYDREKINDGNFTDIIISLTILSRANEESRMKSSRISAAWAAKRDRVSNEKMTSRCPTWLTLAPDRKSFIPIPERVAVINWIYKMAAEGKGQLLIARTLNREEVPTLYGAKRWHISSVKKILDSRSVIGEFQPGKIVDGKRQLLEPVPDYYPTVVPIELFATVQRIRRQRPSFRGRGQSNPIAGIAVNAMTGNKMIRLSKGTDQNYIYLVDAAAPSGAAPYVSWRFSNFMDALLICCQAVTKAPQLPKTEDPELTAAMKRLDEIGTQIPRLVDFIATGFSSAADDKLRTLEKERAALESKVAVLQAEAHAGAVETDQIDWSDAEALKQNIRAVVKQIVIHPAERWFRVELFDGRFVRYAEDGETVVIESNEDAPEALATVSVE